MSRQSKKSADRKRVLVLATAMSAGVGSLVTAVRAQDAAADEGPPVVLERYRSVLEGGTEAQILAALKTIRDEKAKGACPLVEDLLGRGGNVAVVLATIQTVEVLGQETSSLPLIPYVRHREGSVRRAAVVALSSTGGRAAVRSLRAALRGRDPVLRGLAATGLGQIGDATVVPDLFKALDLKVTEAAPSIARLCTPESCAALFPKVTQLPFPVMMETFDAVLLRPAGHLPDAVKIVAIEQLVALKTQRVHQHLVSVQQRWPAGLNPGAKLALDAAVKRTRGAAE